MLEIKFQTNPILQVERKVASSNKHYNYHAKQPASSLTFPDISQSRVVEISQFTPEKIVQFKKALLIAHH